MAECNTITFWIAGVRSKSSPCLESSTERDEARLHASAFGHTYLERDQKQSPADTLDHALVGSRGFDHQQGATEIEPHRAERAVRVEVTSPLDQVERMTIKLRQ